MLRISNCCLYFSVLDIQRLLTFDAVVRTGTFAAAAREVGFTQPGVSQQMRSLERDLKATLFVRAGRGLRLSEQGEVLASRLPTLLAEIRGTEERVAAVARLQASRVRVCAFPSANAMLVPAAISRMRAAQLGIDLELFEAEPPESIDGLRRGEYDVVVAFRYGDDVREDADGSGHDDDTITIPLMREPLVLLMPDSHPLARRQQVNLSELSDERWVAGCVRCRQEFVRACEDAGFSPRIDITTDDNLAVQSCVVAGLGLSVMPQMIQSFVKHPRLRARPLLPERTRVISATVLRTNRRSPAIERVVASLRAAADELSGAGIT